MSTGLIKILYLNVQMIIVIGAWVFQFMRDAFAVKRLTTESSGR